MKFTRYIAVAALLIVALLGISAFASSVPVSNAQPAAVASSAGSVFGGSKQVVAERQVNACPRADYVFEGSKAYLQERVSASAFDQPIAVVIASRINTYERTRFKPKISHWQIGKNGFTGLNGNHFARAGV